MLRGPQRRCAAGLQLLILPSQQQQQQQHHTFVSPIYSMASPTQSATRPRGSTPGQVPPGPVRILVQTRTHLVPGDVYGEKIEYMRNMICQHAWNRNYIRGPDRWNCYGADFGYPDRTCYFLVDHGMTAEHGQPPSENPPVLWYRWTGDSL